MRLPIRRTLWLSALLLTVVVVGIWLLAPPRRITRANFECITKGMTDQEVQGILGECAQSTGLNPHSTAYRWRNGPNRIDVYFRNGRVLEKTGQFVSEIETLRWYAKKGAEKIGVKWE